MRGKSEIPVKSVNNDYGIFDYHTLQLQHVQVVMLYKKTRKRNIFGVFGKRKRITMCKFLEELRA